MQFILCPLSFFLYHYYYFLLLLCFFLFLYKMRGWSKSELFLSYIMHSLFVLRSLPGLCITFPAIAMRYPKTPPHLWKYDNVTGVTLIPELRIQ